MNEFNEKKIRAVRNQAEEKIRAERIQAEDKWRREKERKVDVSFIRQPHPKNRNKYTSIRIKKKLRLGQMVQVGRVRLNKHYFFGLMNMKWECLDSRGPVGPNVQEAHSKHIA